MTTSVRTSGRSDYSVDRRHPLDQLAEVAPGLATQDRRSRPHEVHSRSSLQDDAAAFRLDGLPPEQQHPDILSQVQYPSYSIDIDGIETRKFGHKPFVHCHHTPLFFLPPQYVKRQSAQKDNCDKSQSREVFAYRRARRVCDKRHAPTGLWVLGGGRSRRLWPIRSAFMRLAPGGTLYRPRGAVVFPWVRS